jgi:diacylglycerol kinase (CTP)
VATLQTIRAHVEMDTSAIDDSGASSPPPAPSALLAHGPDAITDNGVPASGVRRRRRSSSIKVKPPPGVTPTKAVDWEIPRKVFHSSIGEFRGKLDVGCVHRRPPPCTSVAGHMHRTRGRPTSPSHRRNAEHITDSYPGFVTLALWWVDPPTVGPLIRYLSYFLAFVVVCDFFRLRYPAFAELWEAFAGFLMREEERTKPNGVIWYLVGVIFVLSIYPRDIAVVSILM